MPLTRAGITAFAAAVMAGPCYTVSGYSVAGNLISELAAQHTRGNFIMMAGFLALGSAMVADGVRRFQGPAVPFIAFGLCMALAGLFGHKPITASVPYSELAHQAHAALASLAGACITIGLVWQGLRYGTPRRRFVALALAVLCVALPLAMLGLPAYQGLIQRIMYLLLFAWLWLYYPGLGRADA
jgi:hypothetical protein